MVTGFYAALAGAASVFIGILTALLASNISNRRSEQTQLIHRIKAIDSRLQSLDEQRQDLENQIDRVRRAMEHEDLENDATERVSQFIDDYVGNEFSPKPTAIDLEDVIDAFANYEGDDTKEIKADEYLTDELDGRLDEIKRELGGRSPYAEADIQPSAEQIAVQRQMDTQRRIHQRDQYNNFQNRWHQTKTDIQTLLNERAKLVPRFEATESIDTDLLWAIVAAIGLSVGVPLFAYLLHISGTVLIRGVQPWVEPTGIFVIWVIGLGIVFHHLRDQFSDDGEDLPNKPEVTLDEVN
ncbi:hypothetical protein [Halorubrum sp. DTA46]|uniref:hypothetical protein n=1 Tax=Halorubrum sp. DTA46 TaxID=3402162 RepID=UPI003AB0C57B